MALIRCFGVCQYDSQHGVESWPPSACSPCCTLREVVDSCLRNHPLELLEGTRPSMITLDNRPLDSQSWIRLMVSDGIVIETSLKTDRRPRNSTHVSPNSNKTSSYRKSSGPNTRMPVVDHGRSELSISSFGKNIESCSLPNHIPQISSSIVCPQDSCHSIFRHSQNHHRHTGRGTSITKA